MTQEINKEINKDKEVFYRKSLVREAILYDLGSVALYEYMNNERLEEIFEESGIADDQEKITQKQVDRTMELVEQEVEAESDRIYESYLMIDLTQAHFNCSCEKN